MKKIKFFSRPIAWALSILLLYTSCQQPESEVFVDVEADTKISGEDLFRSVVFGDGDLADNLSSLESVSTVDEMTKDDLIEYRKLQEDAIAYLIQDNPEYFENFQSQLYSGNAIMISGAITQASVDLSPWLNRVMDPYDLTVADVRNEVALGNDPSNKLLDISSDRACGVAVAVAVVAIVAAVAVWIVAISSVLVVGDSIAVQGRDTLALEAISGQLANVLD